MFLVVTFNDVYLAENYDKLLNAHVICFFFLMTNIIVNLDLMQEYVWKDFQFIFYNDTTFNSIYIYIFFFNKNALLV